MSRVLNQEGSMSIKRVCINLFLIFHLVAITCWTLPVATPLTSGVKDLVRPYFLYAGLFQAWDMFSPSPKTLNNYVEAIVLYKDGNTRVWRFPRMEQLPIGDRYMKERYRKFVENLTDDKNAGLWPDAVRQIARMNDAPKVNMVFLVHYWSFIQPGESGGEFQRGPWDEHVFYSGRIN